MKKLLLTSVITVSLLAPFAASALIIDDFNVGFLTVTDGPGGGSTYSGWVAGDAVGGSRQVVATQVGGTVGAGVSADANPPAGRLSLSSKDGADAFWQIQYFGGGGGISPAANFSAGGALGIFMQFLTADLGGGAVAMSAYDGVNFRNTPVQAVPTGATTMFFPFTSFTLGGGGAVDFSSVLDFEVDVSGVNSYDASIVLLETRERGEVPDFGGTMMLLSIGVGLIGVARWKMNA
jgi:hypothetical protein